MKKGCNCCLQLVTRKVTRKNPVSWPRFGKSRLVLFDILAMMAYVYYGWISDLKMAKPYVFQLLKIYTYILFDIFSKKTWFWEEFDLRTCPKPLVFTLHSFLSAKINRMGIITWCYFVLLLHWRKCLLSVLPYLAASYISRTHIPHSHDFLICSEPIFPKEDK